MSDDVDVQTHPLCQSAHIKALTAHLSFPFGYNMRMRMMMMIVQMM